MRLLAAACLALAPLGAAGCGGGARTAFTNANDRTRASHPGRYRGADAGAVGQVQEATIDEQETTWLLVVVGPAPAAQATPVDGGRRASGPAGGRLVRVARSVEPGHSVPFGLGGCETAPVVLARPVTVLPVHRSTDHRLRAASRARRASRAASAPSPSARAASAACAQSGGRGASVGSGAFASSCAIRR